MSPSPQAEERIIKKALLSRLVEERLLSLFAEGKLFGTVHTCIGQEFSGAVVTEFLKQGDVIFSSHRCHGHFLSFTEDTAGLIAELMGKSTGVCGGFGGSQHLHKPGFFSNGILGGGTPIAAGVGLAACLNKSDSIVVSFLGDGALGEGVVYETFNFVSKWNVPTLFIVEDNGYAQSTSKTETFAGSISARAEAFAIQTFAADTWNWKNLYDVVANAANLVRTQRVPALVVVQTYRLKAHSKGDDSRSQLEVSEYAAKDPLNLLLADPVSAANKLRPTLQSLIEDAVRLADQAGFSTLERTKSKTPSIEWHEAKNPEGRILGMINRALEHALARDPKVIIIGEDVESPYGGAFKVTQNLSNKFPGRVRNTPISEALITGVGTGLALSGYRPIVEIMFGDFSTLILDQLANQAAKFEQMYNGQVKVNLIVRTPMGGRRGYGPTHSQTLDRHFLGIPGLRVVALNSVVNPELIYEHLLTTESGPVLLIENKVMYGSDLRSKVPKGFRLLHSNETLPCAWLKPESDRIDATLIGYGGMSEQLVQACEILFDEYEIVAQALCPSQIYPFSVDNYNAILNKSRAIVFVEEGQGFGSFISEVVAQLAELNPDSLNKIKRVMPLASCIPASGALEKAMLPGTQDIVEACTSLIP